MIFPKKQVKVDQNKTKREVSLIEQEHLSEKHTKQTHSAFPHQPINQQWQKNNQ
jgi:hypothetical protein